MVIIFIDSFISIIHLFYGYRYFKKNQIYYLKLAPMGKSMGRKITLLFIFRELLFYMYSPYLVVHLPNSISSLVLELNRLASKYFALSRC